MAQDATGSKPSGGGRGRRNLPARRGAVAQVIALPEGQAALFDDPQELLKLDDQTLAGLAHGFGKAAGSMFCQLQRGVGLVAWTYWHRLDEAAYGQWIEDYAVVVGKGAQTLRKWRDEVVTVNHLAVPALAQMRRSEHRELQKGRSEGGSGKKYVAPPLTSGFAPPATPLALEPPLSAPSRWPRATSPPIPATITRANADGPSEAVLEVRQRIGVITTTPADSLATCCTTEVLKAARERINEALQIHTLRAAGVQAGSCDHPKANWKNVGYATICDPAKGGCGEKVR